MSSNLIGSLIWIIFIFLSVFTHMIIKSLSGEVDFIITLFSRFVYSLPILFILAHLARKAFFPAPLPFPLVHVDTEHNFPETISFRDDFAKKYLSKENVCPIIMLPKLYSYRN